MPQRLQQLEQWLDSEVGLPPFSIEPASADASFRRYFRVRFDGESRIAMDAPPERESVGPFVEIARQLHSIGLNVPQIHAEDRQQGFLLLSDLGNTLYLDRLNDDTVEQLYGDAMSALATLQASGPGESLPPYSEALLRQEMSLFTDWYLGTHLGIELDDREWTALHEVFDLLVANALEQPQVTVHRDYHSRNLMVTEHNPGILDFQDAVCGPVTYDLASLLRDCYIDWPQDQVEQWVRGYHDIALEQGVLREPVEERFLRWFDLMGVQRHLKAIGIFARLNHRDGKPGYLGDIPRTLGYVRAVAGRYTELTPLFELISKRLDAA